MDVDESKLISILMPVFNERAFLKRSVERVVAAPLPDSYAMEIVLVDDASADGTDVIVKQLSDSYPDLIRAFRHDVNLGKGAAIRTAVSEMRGRFAIIQDADLEYNPEEYTTLLKPLLEADADVVYGSRFCVRDMRRVLFYHHKLGNWLLTQLSNLTTGLDLTDMETCYKAFRSELIKTIPIRSNRFGFEPEITAKISKRGCVVYEVPISYRGRTYSEGKKIGWKDGFSAIYTILKYTVIDDCFDEEHGHAVLATLSNARKFSRWMVKKIQPYLGNNILEIGSGIGNISRFLPKKERLTVTDIDSVYLKLLKNSYDGNSIVDVKKLDVTSDEDILSFDKESYDTIVFLNVLEHIENDIDALCRIKRLLSDKGRLIVLVPQHEWLYGSYDKNVGHFRRYTRKKLMRALSESGYTVLKVMNFNRFATPGWWINSVLLKRNEMGKIQLKIYDTLVPILSLMDRIFPLPGLSLIAIAQKNDEG